MKAQSTGCCRDVGNDVSFLPSAAPLNEAKVLLPRQQDSKGISHKLELSKY